MVRKMSLVQTIPPIRFVRADYHKDNDTQHTEREAMTERGEWTMT